MELFLLLTAYYFYITDWSLFISFTFFVKMCVFSKLVYYLTIHDNNNLLYDYIKSFYLGVICIKDGLVDTFKFYKLTNNILINYEHFNNYFKKHLLQKIVINFYQVIIYLVSKVIIYYTPKNNIQDNQNNIKDLKNENDIDDFLNELSHYNMS